MGKSSDQLREEIDAERADAGAKINDLQDQIQHQVEDTRQQVMDTASDVRDEAQAVVTDAVDSVKQAVEGFDIEGFVQQRPMVSVGVAMLGGFLIGSILGSDDDNHHSSHQSWDSGRGSVSGGTGNVSSGGSSAGGIGSSLRSAAKKSGLEDTISNAGAALVGTATEQLKDMVDKNFPGFSNKLSDAQQQSGSFAEKANTAQQDAQSQ